MPRKGFAVRPRLISWLCLWPLAFLYRALWKLLPFESFIKREGTFKRRLWLIRTFVCPTRVTNFSASARSSLGSHLPLPWGAAFSSSDHNLPRGPIVSNKCTWMRLKLPSACLMGVWAINQWYPNPTWEVLTHLLMFRTRFEDALLYFMADSPTYSEKYFVVNASWPRSKCHECSSLPPVGSKRHFSMVDVWFLWSEKSLSDPSEAENTEAEPRDASYSCCETTSFSLLLHSDSDIDRPQICSSISDSESGKIWERGACLCFLCRLEPLPDWSRRLLSCTEWLCLWLDRCRDVSFSRRFSVSPSLTTDIFSDLSTPLITEIRIVWRRFPSGTVWGKFAFRILLQSQFLRP